MRAAAPRVGLWNEMRRQHKVPWLLFKLGQLQESLRSDALLRKLATRTLSHWGDLPNLGVIPLPGRQPHGGEYPIRLPVAADVAAAAFTAAVAASAASAASAVAAAAVAAVAAAAAPAAAAPAAEPPPVAAAAVDAVAPRPAAAVAVVVAAAEGVGGAWGGGRAPW